MAVTLRPNEIKLRTQTGEYQSPVVLGDTTVADHVAQVNAAITAKGEETLESIPEDYTELSGEVADLKSAIKQTETHQIRIESGTFNDNNGTKVTNAKRLRNVSPIPVSGLYSITLPEGYSGWLFRCDKNGGHINNYSGWLSGEVIIREIITEDTKYINISIRKTATPNDDISGDVAIVESGISIETDVDYIREMIQHGVVGKNIFGNVLNIYYPVFIKAGEKVTWSCEDGEPLVPSGFNVYFYDKNKTQVSYYGSAVVDGQISRTVTPSASTDIYYIRVVIASASYQWRQLQIEVSSTVTDYEPYIPNNLKLNEEIEKQNRYLSKNVAFSVSAGSSHSSRLDKVSFDLDAGEEYGVFVKSNIDGTVNLYEYNGTADTSKGPIKTNKFYAFIPTTNVTDLGLYVSNVSIDATFTLIVYRANSIDGVLHDAIPDITPIDIGARMVEFSVNASSTHSSLSNQIELSADEGTYLFCVATGLQGRTGSVFVRNDETEQSVVSLTDGIIVRVKAPFGVKRLGLYVGSGAEKANIFFAAFTDKSVLAMLTEKTAYDNSYLTKLLNAKRKANPGNYNSQTSPELFTLAHFSDIHGSAWAMKQVQEFKDTYQSYLDDVICTGDVVSDKIADGTAFWSDNSDGEILVCIGNHDSLGSNGWANPVDQQTLYETYIEPYEDNWDAETVNGHSYWYKDYSDKKIRLIAVDATIYDATEQANQMTWLNAALSGAITNSYAVVGAIHFPPMPTNFHKIDSNFTALLHGTAGDMSQFAWHTYHTYILETVDQFIDDGGDFVCWLSGHTHYDLVSYDDRFPKQLFITISCAMPSSLFEEKIRDTGRGAGLVLNTVCVDTARKYVKLIRYGAEWDDCLRHTGTCVIKYDANPPIVMFSN